MKERLRKFSLTAAGFGSLILAAVAVACGVSPWRTTIRALLGAVIVYVLVRIVSELAVRVLMDRGFDKPQDNEPIEEPAGDSGS